MCGTHASGFCFSDDLCCIAFNCSYAYDALGRPTEKKDYFNTPAPDLTHSYSYNGRGELAADAMSRGGNIFLCV